MSMMRWVNLVRYVRNWWTYFPAKYHLSRRDPVQFELRSGLTAEVPLRMLHTFKEVFFEDEYGSGLPPLKLSLDRAVVIDIGANVGYFSLYALSRFAGSRVIAFEPIPVNQALFETHQRLNPGADLTLDKRAVFGETTRVKLGYDATDSFTTCASVRDQDDSHAMLEVETVTLPGIFEAYKLAQCDLLKLDCEGAEYSILYGCPDGLWERIRNIAMEVHPGLEPGQDFEALSAFLRTKGFTVRGKDRQFLWCWR